MRTVIVKGVCENFANGLTTVDLGKPDYELACAQHAKYVEAIRKCSVEVIVLEKDEEFPDSVFVEDVAILTERCAIIASPGALSRRGEVDKIQPVIHDLFGKVEYITPPGFLEGGDVLQVEEHFYIGLSTRTNLIGAEQLQKILAKHGYNSLIITLAKFFHLKTGLSYLGNNKLLLAGEFIGHPAFESYEQIRVKDEEEYAANCIVINDHLLMPKGFDKTRTSIDQRYKIIELEMSEFQKQDGGLSCLSLRI